MKAHNRGARLRASHYAIAEKAGGRGVAGFSPLPLRRCQNRALLCWSVAGALVWSAVIITRRFGPRCIARALVRRSVIVVRCFRAWRIARPLVRSAVIVVRDHLIVTGFAVAMLVVIASFAVASFVVAMLAALSGATVVASRAAIAAFIVVAAFIPAMVIAAVVVTTVIVTAFAAALTATFAAAFATAITAFAAVRKGLERDRLAVIVDRQRQGCETECQGCHGGGLQHPA
jgi:hypothetical protein